MKGSPPFIHHSSFRIHHFHRLSRPERVEYAEGRPRGGGELAQGYGRGAAATQRLADGAHLFALPLVLRAQACAGLAAVAVCERLAKVVDDERAPAAENFHALLAHRAVAFGEVRDRAVRAVGEAERDEDRVLADGLAVVGRDRLGVDARDRRARQELHEVYEVADLADDSAAALLRVLRPVRARHAARV